MGKTPQSVPLESLCLQRCSTPLDFSSLLHSCGFWEMGSPASESIWRLLPKAEFRQKRRKGQKFCHTPPLFLKHPSKDLHKGLGAEFGVHIFSVLVSYMRYYVLLTEQFKTQPPPCTPDWCSTFSFSSLAFISTR